MTTYAKALTAARRIARRDGLGAVSSRTLCAALGISDGSFRHYTGTTVTAIRNQITGVSRVGDLRDVTRISPAIRKAHILHVARKLPKGFTGEQLSTATGVSLSLVKKYFGGVAGVRRALEGGRP